MQKEDNEELRTGDPSPIAQEVMRNIVSAIRAVKLYPSNNPVYAQSIGRAYKSLEEYLRSASQYAMGIQKANFLFQQTPIAKDTQINKAIAQDLFSKGIREILFLNGLVEAELVDLLLVLSLSPEEIALRGGIVSILWEKGVTHVKVTESTLDEVVTTTQREQTEMLEKAYAEPAVAELDAKVSGQELVVVGKRLTMGDVVADPKKFGAAMLDISRETASAGESVEDRLHAQYHEAVEQIKQQDSEQSEALFQGLAKSVLAMEPEHRDRFITTKLYADMDSENVRNLSESMRDQVNDVQHEIVTGRYAKQWTVQQVSTLLKKTAAPKVRPAAPAVSAALIPASPIPQDIAAMALQVQEYTPEEMDAMKEFSDIGMESDIMEAAVRTLIFLLPSVANPQPSSTTTRDISLFSNVVHQIEDVLSYLLQIKDYALARLVVRALRMPVDAVFTPRLKEAIQKAAAPEVIRKVTSVIHKSPKDSPAQLSAYSFLIELEREATPALLEQLVEEKDPSVRRFLFDLLKNLGKNQIELLGDRLNDDRWFFVKNIVSILGENKADQTIGLLEKVANHKNPMVRLEVVKGLLSIGGQKAAALLAGFLKDKDDDIRFITARGLGTLRGVGRNELQALTSLVKELAAKRKNDYLLFECVKVLGQIGSADTQAFLMQYLKIRWWRSRRPQEELRDAAQAAINEIQRRLDRAGKSA